MCTIFVRYLKDYKKQDLSSYTGESAVFADAKDISSWALESVSIAQKMKLIEGSNVGGAVKFLPKDSVTRAAAATVFMRFDKMTASASKPEEPDKPCLLYTSLNKFIIPYLQTPLLTACIEYIEKR